MVKYYFLIAAIAFVLALTGCMGPRGTMGRPGVSIVGPKGDQGDPGTDGTDGSDGSDGAPGAVGPTGPQGPAGADGEIAQIVPLCPGTTTYPNTFVEVAMLINGGLYGVYSANGGFLTYFPPGTYHSNAIGSSCNFRINADNSITPLWSRKPLPEAQMIETLPNKWRLKAYGKEIVIKDNISAKGLLEASIWAEAYCSSYGWTFELIPLKKD